MESDSDGSLHTDILYTEDDLLPLSALQHLSFCERQWGLIHLEGVWDENPLTVEGNILHQRSDEYGTEVRTNVRIVRGLRLRSLKLGLSGKADVVEFHRMGSATDDGKTSESAGGGGGISLQGVRGRWMPFPVEYKRGRPKKGLWDEVQLCAQALCLEEMLGISISAGALFYGKTRRRHDVCFDSTIRDETEALAARLHELNALRVTPPPVYGKHCERCSLRSYCLPEFVSGRNVRRYLDMLFTVSELKDIR